MKYNLLGNTGLRVSELCLGTMTFGGRGFFSAIGSLGQDAVDEQVKLAVDAGINFIDTANMYSFGLSEELTGQAIRNLGLNRDDLIIATKVAAKMGEGPNEQGLNRKHIMQQVEDSLKRLKTDYIDLYQIHGFDHDTPLEDTLETLDILVKSGKVRYIGASNIAAWHLMKSLDYSAYNRLSKFVSMQVHYSLLTRDIEREIVPVTKDQKIGMMIWSPLSGGLLSGKYSRNGSSGEGRMDKSDFLQVNKDKAFDILDVLHNMAAEKNASVAQLALGWLLQQQGVTSLIIGANSVSQLEENFKATEVTFTAAELEQLDQISQLSREYPGWMLKTN